MNTKIYLYLIPVISLACSNKQEKLDSYKVSGICAVVYSPDSLKIQELKSNNSEEDFYTITDDNLYYISGATEYLEKQDIRLLFTKKRILEFSKTNGQVVAISLDTINPAWGVYLFEPNKDPLNADIMVIEPDFKSYFQIE